MGNKDDGYLTKVQSSTKTAAGKRTIAMNKAAISAARELFEMFPNTTAVAVNKNGKKVTCKMLKRHLSKY